MLIYKYFSFTFHIDVVILFSCRQALLEGELQQMLWKINFSEIAQTKTRAGSVVIGIDDVYLKSLILIIEGKIKEKKYFCYSISCVEILSNIQW